MCDAKFTVFTPTYNRAYILPRSYDALCRQTCSDFVWLIIDDGSTDNTKELVESWIGEGKIRIKYVYQENAGKQRAVNTGVLNCDTKYFGFLDSDDYYCAGTVEKFLSLFKIIENNDHVAGIMARKGTDEFTPIGSPKFPAPQGIYNYDTLVRRYGFYGDTCRAYKTEILREHLYPEIEDKFILESVMLAAIDQHYDLLIKDEVFTVSEYMDDGYSKNVWSLYHRNPYGYALGIGMITASKRGLLRQIKYTVMFTVWCKIYAIPNAAKIVKNKMLYRLCMPLSAAAYAVKYPRWMFDKAGD